MDINEIIEKVKKEALEIEKFVENTEQASNQKQPESFASMPSQDSERQNEWYLQKKDSYTVQELLQIPSDRYVKEIYRHILRREPDDAYLEYEKKLYGKSLSKLDILLAIRLSPEGKRKGIKIKGMYKKLLSNKLKKIPILGYMYDLLISAGKIPLLKKEIQNLAFDLEKISVHLGEYTESLEKKAEAEEVKKLANQFDEKITQVGNTFTASLENKADIAALEEKADRRELDSKADIAALEEKADRRELDSKADIADLEEKADRWELDSKADIADLEEKADRRELDNKADIADLEEKADRRELLAFKEAVRYAELYFHILNEELLFMINEIKESLTDNTTKKESAENILKIATDMQEHIYDKMYLDFEELFRGSEDNVAEKLNIYKNIFSKLIKKINISKKALDLGTGRGEMLAFLDSLGFEAKGVDLNKIAVSSCMDKGYDALCTDALSYLKTLKPKSLSLVTSLHMVEHLDNDVLLSIIKECNRVLEDNGMVVFETPNPRNILVGSGEFYRDFTHNKPLFPDTLKFFLEYFGFSDVKIYYFDSDNKNLIDSENISFDTLQDYVEISRDYAVVGYKKCV